MNDHELAGYLADHAGQALLALRDDALAEGANPWDLRHRGDMLGHNLLVDALAEHRPTDAVLSEEGADDRSRLDAARTWIVDPLDGTQDYPFAGSSEWAVHVALVEGGQPTAGAVSVPCMHRLYGTDLSPVPERGTRSVPMIVSSRSNTYFAADVADALGGRLTACGSAGVKAMLVVGGDADVYVHASGLYEWDVCAPAAVAAAAGMTVRDLDGDEIDYNKSHPVVRGLVIARPEYADVVAATLGW
jgi:3'(2'), 5'-bisphosphate nucleotidase